MRISFFFFLLFLFVALADDSSPYHPSNWQTKEIVREIPGSVDNNHVINHYCGSFETECFKEKTYLHMESLELKGNPSTMEISGMTWRTYYYSRSCSRENMYSGIIYIHDGLTVEPSLNSGNSTIVLNGMIVDEMHLIDNDTIHDLHIHCTPSIIPNQWFHLKNHQCFIGDAEWKTVAGQPMPPVTLTPVSGGNGWDVKYSVFQTRVNYRNSIGCSNEKHSMEMFFIIVLFALVVIISVFLCLSLIWLCVLSRKVRSLQDRMKCTSTESSVVSPLMSMGY